MATKQLRKDFLTRSRAHELPTSLLSKLYRWYDPSICQEGQKLMERVASKHLTLGTAITVDNNDPVWVASPPSLDFTGDDFASGENITYIFNPVYALTSGHYWVGITESIDTGMAFETDGNYLTISEEGTLSGRIQGDYLSHFVEDPE